MKKSTRRAWSQEDIDWLKNEFHDWKKSYIQTNFSSATEEGIKKWIVRIPELFLKRCSTHLEKTTTAVKKKLMDLRLIVK